MTASSPASVLAFLWMRTAKNTVATRLARLREPRYLLGALLFLCWLASLVARGGRRAEFARKAGGSAIWPLLEPAAAFALAAFVLLFWVFARGEAALPLTEAEVQFLFPAPLPRRSILHFATLKPLAGVFVSSAFLTLLGIRSDPVRALRGFLAVFLVLATLHLHLQGLSLRRAAWREAGGVRGVLGAATRIAALVLLGVLALLAVAVGTEGWGALGRGGAGVASAAARALAASPLAFVLRPFRALVAPFFALESAAFLRALPAAALLLVLHHFWVVGAQVSYEDATLDAASRRARARERRRDGRASAPSERRRGTVPFRLREHGTPEVALLWKGLLAEGRMPLSRLAPGAALLCAALFFGGRLAAARAPAIGARLGVFGAAIAVLGVFFSMVVMPVAGRLDFRRDLLYASAMKLWPIAPARLAAAELAAPLVVSARLCWIALAAGLSLSAAGSGPPELPLLAQVPLALGAAILTPAAAAVVLVVQNGLTLAFPIWFPPGQKMERGFATSGSRLIGLVATLLLFSLAAIPSAILAGLAVFAGRGLLGLWIAPIAAALAALPLAVEVGGGVFLLGKLFERFDPSLDVETS